MSQLRSVCMKPPVRPSTRTQPRDIVLFLPIGGTLVLCNEKTPGQPSLSIKLVFVSERQLGLDLLMNGKLGTAIVTPTATDDAYLPLDLRLRNPYPLSIKAKGRTTKYKLTFEVPAGYSLHHLSYLHEQRSAR